MSPLDLVLWAGAFGAALIIVSTAVALAVLAVRSALSATMDKQTKDADANRISE